MQNLNLSRLRRNLDKTLSEGQGKQLLWLIAIIVAFIFIFWAIALLAFPGKEFGWQDILALFLDPGSFGGHGEHDLFRLIATLTGVFLLSALLISVVGNMFENISESFRTGQSRYRHKDHILILGGGHQVQDMLSAISDPASPYPDGDVVILTSCNLDELRHRIASCFDGPSGRALERRTTLYYGDRDSEKDLMRKDLAKNSKVIYIIGEDNEPDHDSISARCCNYLKKLCSGSGRPIPCYMVLEDRASLDIYKYSKDKETVQGSDLKVDVIYDNEYIAEQALIPDPAKDGDFPTIDHSHIYPEGNGYRTVYGITGDSEKHVHLIIAGTSDLALAMAQTAAQICHFPNYQDGRNRTVISLVDKGIKDKMSQLVSSYYNLFSLSHYRYIGFNDDGNPFVSAHEPDSRYGDFLDIEWEFIDAGICSTEFSPLLKAAACDDTQSLSVIICLDKPSDITFAATHLPEEIYRKGCPVLVHQKDYTEILDLAARTRQFGNLHIFGMSSIKHGDPLFTRRSESGQMVNFIYDQNCNEEYRHGNPIDAWYDLKEAHKLSSIYCANALYVRMRSFGLEEFDLSGIDEAQKASLYETEHRRWVMANLLLGFRAMDTVSRNDLKQRILTADDVDKKKDTEFSAFKSRFIHPDITPYTDLLPEERDKDKILLENLSYILGRNQG